MSKLQLKTVDLFTPDHTRAWSYLEKTTYPWEILADIAEIIREIGETLDPELYHHPSDGVWIAKSAKISTTAGIGAPCIIGENTEVRHCAYIRGSALIGDGCVVGNSTELKNVILFDGVQVPHYNYVGDSILGYKSHLGAGAITSNVKSDRSLVVVKPSAACSPALSAGVEPIETGRRKFGAILSDYVEVGCGSVLNPGTVVGMYTNIYPLTSVRGVIPSRSIVKSGGDVEIAERRFDTRS